MKWLKSRWLSDAATAFGLIAAVLLAIGTLEVWGIIAGALAVLAFLGSLGLRWREARVRRQLLDEIRDELSVDRVLDVVARHLHLGGSNGGWRLSLYELDVAAEEWVLSGRASSNELYADRRDAPRFRHDQGVLRACLAGSEQPLGRFDEMPILPPPEEPEWLSTLIAWGTPETEARAFRMKSRVYCGAVFKVGPQDGHQPTLGVVAESEAPDGVNIRTLEGALTRPFFESVAELVLLRGALDRLAPSSRSRPADG